jgi:GPH family glycoside/pentoside/hexuronide:cation symporter
MLVTAMITVLTVKEPKRAAQEASAQQGIFKTYAAAMRNKPFVMVFTSYALHICGTVVVQAALIYYFKYIYGGAANLQIALALLLIPVLPSIWIWTALSKRIGKRWSWNLGMALVVVAVIAIFLFARQAGPTFFYIVMAFAGLGLSTNYVMPFAVIPDTVELDYAEHGVRREGAFYGVFNFMNKVGVAFANLIGGLVLSGFGYVANADQTEHAKLGIQLLVGPFAAVFFIAGIVVFSFYPITRKYYDTVIMPKVAVWNKKNGLV